MAFSLSQHVRRTDGRTEEKEGAREGRQAMTTAACTSPSLSPCGVGARALALVGVHAQKHASLPLFFPSGPSLG